MHEDIFNWNDCDRASDALLVRLKLLCKNSLEKEYTPRKERPPSTLVQLLYGVKVYSNVCSQPLHQILEHKCWSALKQCLSFEIVGLSSRSEETSTFIFGQQGGLCVCVCVLDSKVDCVYAYCRLFALLAFCLSFAGHYLRPMHKNCKICAPVYQVHWSAEGLSRVAEWSGTE